MKSSPDFVKLAEAYGAVGLRATKPEEVEPVIRQALCHPQAGLHGFSIDPNECVYPMVPAGAALTEMLLVKVDHATCDLCFDG